MLGFLLLSIISIFNVANAMTLNVQDVVFDVKSAMDLTVDPCHDFYAYSCGGWIKNTTLPPTKARLSKSFSAVEDFNENILKTIVENKNTGKINVFFNSCMNESYIDSIGFQPVLDVITSIVTAPITDVDSLIYLSGQLYNEGISSFFSYSPSIDSGDPSMVYGQLDQGGLGLPYPSLYLSNDNSSANIRQEYIQHITNIFNLYVKDPVVAASAAKQAYSIELMIANFTVPAVDLFDPFTTYNKLTLAQLNSLFPEISRSFFPSIGATGQNLPVLVTVPSFFANLSAALSSLDYNLPIAVSDYLIWQVLRQKSQFLSKPFRDEHFRFYNTILGGQSKPNPRWMQCVQYIDSSIGELLGNYFVKLAFPEQSRKSAVNLLNGIISAMKDDINSVSWMDGVTRSRALTKLSLVTNFIGSPINFDTYKPVVITSDDFYGNIRNSLIYSVSKNLGYVGMFSNESLKSAWEMTASTVNAYYEPTKNQMVFPAGILQTPFFDYSFPLEMQVGAVGMVMGHELTHGFDSQGRLYDGTGKLINWWLPSTSKLFDTKVGCVIDQYSQFEILPGVHLDGKLTQGENIADMGGIKNAFHLAELLLGVQFNQPSIVPGLTSAQLFFVSFAQLWCEVSSEASIKLRVKTDPHSPGKFRVLGPLINLPKFAEIFQCPVGSVMNPGPGKSCQVW